MKLRTVIGFSSGIWLLAIAACAAEPNDFPSPPPEYLTGAAATRAAPSPTPLILNKSHLPDLVISAVTSLAPPSCYDSHSRVGATVTINNTGHDSGAFMVEVNGIWQAVPEGLKAGQSRTLWFDAKSFSIPWEGIDARVDPANQVVEDDEGNNIFTGIVATLTPPLPCPTTTPPWK